MKPVAIPRLTSDAARQRILSRWGEPLFLANWDNAVFIHYESEVDALQSCVPFALDLFHGRAFVSVVAFTLRNMRPRLGGKPLAALLKPISTHHFFNVRTYVRHNGEAAIYFMAEWLSNRLSVALGPITFGLPYHFGKIDYANDGHSGRVSGHVSSKDGSFHYQGSIDGDLTTCDPGSFDEFALERYTAFTSAGWRTQFFRVWHEPWPQCPAEVKTVTDNLLGATGDWWPTARLMSAHYSPGVSVWMGRPHFVASASGRWPDVTQPAPTRDVVAASSATGQSRLTTASISRGELGRGLGEFPKDTADPAAWLQNRERDATTNL